jgi:hypothetical protein
MLGLPSTPGPVGAAMLLLGVVVGVVVAVPAWRGPLRGWERATAATLAAALAVTVGSIPFTAWRIVEDLRFTTGLNDEEMEGAGPIHNFIQPYLLDDVVPLIPEDDTYVAVAGPEVQEALARTAFPYMALTRLFPRVAVERPADADWIVAWSQDPRDLAVEVRDVRVVRPAQGTFPAVTVARVS